MELVSLDAMLAIGGRRRSPADKVWQVKECPWVVCVSFSLSQTRGLYPIESLWYCTIPTIAPVTRHRPLGMEATVLRKSAMISGA